MRFFSNEAKDNTDERDPDARADQGDQTERAQSDPAAVPQQRAGSPWQHGPAEGGDRPEPADGGDRQIVAEPAPQPTAFGASTVGGAVAASATAGPYESDTRATGRTGSDMDDDRTVPLGDRPAADPDRTEVTGTDRSVDADDETARSGAKPHTDTRRDDDNPVDLALDDRGTFDDPQVRTDDDKALDDKPVDDTAVHDKADDEKADQDLADHDDRPDAAAPAADEPLIAAAKAEEKPAAAGPMPFFPAGDTDALRERWRDVQLRFVDDPKGATAEAAGLVDEAVDKLTTALRDHRGSLSKGTEETEALRVELRAYRDILDRLLGL